MQPTEPIDPEAVEEHYRTSPFIKELCVVEVCGEGLRAVVVPDRDVLRSRRVVNIRELIRFELEGLSISRPPHERIVSFDVTMEPLPRTETARLQRDAILGRYRGGSAAPAEPEPPADEHVARVVVLVREAVRPGLAVHAGSNLELDLDLDSMDRVALFASLEERFGVRVPADIAQSVFLVRDLAEAFRGAVESAGSHELAWARLLEAPAPGAELRALVKPRPLTAIALFAVARVVGSVLARPRASGRQCLPRRGPFIISPNHQSYLDPFAVMSVLPFGVFRQIFFVGAAEYFETPFTAWLARRMNIVAVDPDANLLAGMQTGAFGLRHGKVLMLFPEGERSIDGSVKKFKNGAAILSQHLQVPIVPVAIDGTFALWPRNRPFNWRRLLPWSGHHVRIRFGDAITGDGRSPAQLTERLRDRVNEMWTARDG